MREDKQINKKLLKKKSHNWINSNLNILQGTEETSFSRSKIFSPNNIFSDSSFTSTSAKISLTVCQNFAGFHVSKLLLDNRKNY